MLLLKTTKEVFENLFKRKAVTVGKGCFFTVIGFLGGTMLRFGRFLFDVVIKGVISVLLFFGLYVPFLHLVFGGALWLFAGINPFDLSVNSQLYIFGLTLCFADSVIITVRNLLFKPIRSMFELVTAVKYKSEGRSYKPESPKIYRSKANPDLIVYEYSDRYELFREHNGRLLQVRTEGKRGKR